MPMIMTNSYITMELWEKLVEEAGSLGVSKAEVIRRALTCYFSIELERRYTDGSVS